VSNESVSPDSSARESARAIRAGDRRIMARTITRLESTRDEDREIGQAVLEALIAESGDAIRVGITGPPGVGKSTFIEALGLHLIEEGKRVAVLAVDPSSPVTGGSILGDKTRMDRLAVRPEAFIRPSPSGGALGGVADRTREVMLLCEAAGYDVVLIETVGIGQSEVAVSSMVDFFLVMLLPAGGDELQGIKKGVVELADTLVVNKADGEMKTVAERTRADYGGALELIRPSSDAWRPRAMTVSALESSITNSCRRTGNSTSEDAGSPAPGCGSCWRMESTAYSGNSLACVTPSSTRKKRSQRRRRARPPPRGLFSMHSGVPFNLIARSQCP